MTDTNQKQLGNTLWSIADQLRGAMDADDFRDYMLSFLFLRYLSDNYETAAKKELGRDYPDVGGDARKVPLALWYANNVDDIPAFEKQMRRKVHYVIQPAHLWNSIANFARTQNPELLNTLQAGFKYIETESRKEEPRYSRRVEMDEIKKNDFNLNISRYISTAVGETEIDLAATHDQLEEISKAIQQATSRHNQFLKELGLPQLPSAGTKSPAK